VTFASQIINQIVMFTINFTKYVQLYPRMQYFQGIRQTTVYPKSGSYGCRVTVQPSLERSSSDLDGHLKKTVVGRLIVMLTPLGWLSVVFFR
jgi:hypothetical protein